MCSPGESLAELDMVSTARQVEAQSRFRDIAEAYDAASSTVGGWLLYQQLPFLMMTDID